MMKTACFFLILLISFSIQVFGVGSGITYNGRLLDPNGNAVNSSNVQFRLQIRTPGNENCLMYEEIQTKDMTNSDGIFSITINDGTGSRVDSSGFTLDQIFANRGSFTFTSGQCAVGTTYNTSPADGRKLQVYFNDGSFATGQWEPTPAMAINFIPMAIEAQQVGGYKKEQILKLADGVSTTGSELDATKWTSLQALINGTSSAYVKPSDQVTQLYGATVPTPSNGQSIRWNSSLNAGAGGWENFTAGSGGGSVTTVSSANADIGVTNGSTTPQLTLNSGTGANQIVKLNASSQLPAVDGANLTNVNASKVGGTTVSLAALTNGQVLKYNGSNWVNASLTDNDTLGGLSCANGRVAYYSGSAWGCLEVTSGNTINTIVSRDGSGESIFGSVNTGTLKLNDGATGVVSLSTPVTVASYAMRLPTSVGTAGQVLTTDGNSPAQLSWASASSQWTTSGSNIYYNTGNVGIGATSPSVGVHILKAQDVPMRIETTGTYAAGFDLWNSGSRKGTFGIVSLAGQFVSGSAVNDFVFRPDAGGNFIFGNSTETTQLMKIMNSGNVGIGTATPSSTLDVNGSLNVNGGVTLSSGTGQNVLVASSTVDIPNSLSQQIDSTITVAPTGMGQNLSAYNGYFMTSYNSTFNGTATGKVISLYGRAVNAGSATIQNLTGVNGSVGLFNAGAGSVANGYGIYGDVNASTSSITKAYGGYFSTSGNNANIATGYGVYVGSIVGTSKYSLYASDSTAPSYFAGNVGVGASSPGVNLDVVGTTGIRFQRSGASSSIRLSDFGGNIPTIYLAGTDTSVATYLHSRGPFRIFSGGNDPGSAASYMGLAVTTSGTVGVGTTAPDQTFSVNGDASKAGGGSWQTFSDARLKTVNGDFTRGLDEILKLQPISYHYNDRNPAGIPNEGDHIGFVAQEVEKVIPEAISKSKKGYLMVNNDPIIWTMFNAIKELYYKISGQENSLAKVSQENEILKNKIQNLEQENQSIKAYLCEKDPKASLCR